MSYKMKMDASKAIQITKRIQDEKEAQCRKMAEELIPEIDAGIEKQANDGRSYFRYSWKQGTTELVLYQLETILQNNGYIVNRIGCNTFEVRWNAKAS